MNKDDDMLANYFSKLAKQDKIVWVAEVMRAPETPKEIRFLLLKGNTGNRLSRYEYMQKGLVCRTIRLGQPKKTNTIVYLEDNAAYVKMELKKQEMLDERLEANENERRKILKQMSRLGRN